MRNDNIVIEGSKTLVRGAKLIYKDIVKPSVKGGARIGKKIAARRKRKREVDTGF